MDWTDGAATKRGSDSPPVPAVYAIPFHGKYLIYRPLLQLAFVGNAAMVNIVADLINGRQPVCDGDVAQARQFLESLGFLQPDPPCGQPLPQRGAFKPTGAVCLLTTACNLRCVYCYASSGESTDKQDFPLELGQRAIDTVCRNAAELGESSFSLSFHGGGEPTLARGVFRPLVEYARGLATPCRISLTSNGYWSTSLREWILDNLDEVSLSFDGTQALQDRQRPLRSGKGSFDVVMQTIRAMDRRDFRYGIRMTVTDWGTEQLADAVDFLCRETECQTFQVEPAFDQGRAQSNDSALGDNNRFAQAFLQAHDIAAAADRHVYYSGARPWVVTDRFCQAVENALIVAPDGGLSACYEVFGRQHELAPDFFVGKLGRDGAVSIDTPVRDSLHQRIDERRQMCRDCFCYWHCAGDCPPKSMTADGKGHLQFGARCELNRVITRELLGRYAAAGHGIWRGGDPALHQHCEARA